MLAPLLRDYAITENLGSVFEDADRTTSVEVGLIKLYKPVVSESFDYDGFFMEEDEEEKQQTGITEFNEVRAVVNRYVAVMKAFDVMRDQLTYINGLLGGANISSISMNLGYEKSVTTKEDFSRIVQKESWQYIFKRLNMDKYVTSGVMKDINKFIETQSKVPFTMKNIYRMLQIIVDTRQNTWYNYGFFDVKFFKKGTAHFKFKDLNDWYLLNKAYVELKGFSLPETNKK